MKKIEDITLINELGSGTFGVVYLSKKDGRSEDFVTKVLRRDMMDMPDKKKYLQNEIEILQELKHPNICKLEEVKVTQKYYLLVMEYVNGGSLSKCLEQYKEKYKVSSFPEIIVQRIMRQVINAFKYIHSKNIMHRDITLENIMVNYTTQKDKDDINLLNAQIKIIDFGVAIKGFGKTVIGNPLTMDPRILKKYQNSRASVINEKLIYDLKIDIWSIGVICYNMIIGKNVFNSSSLDDLVNNVEKGNYTVPTNLSKEIVSFLNAMLQYNQENRLSAEKLAKHPFLTEPIINFHKINLRKVSKKIDYNGLNINTKKNNTIWSIFNENDEKILLSIKGNSLKEADTISQGTINSYPSISSSISTSNSIPNESNFSEITNNSNMTNTHNEPFFNYYNQFPKYSFYGQKMHIEANQNTQNFPEMQNRINIPNRQKRNISPNMQIMQNRIIFPNRQNRQFCPNMQNIERPNMGIQQYPFRKLPSDNINLPNEIYNNFNMNPNLQGQRNQLNNIGKIEYNKGFSKSTQIYNNQYTNEGDFDEEKVCIIM